VKNKTVGTKHGDAVAQPEYSLSTPPAPWFLKLEIIRQSDKKKQISDKYLIDTNMSCTWGEICNSRIQYLHKSHKGECIDIIFDDT
jgi:hypothetical protein